MEFVVFLGTGGDLNAETVDSETGRLPGYSGWILECFKGFSFANAGLSNTWNIIEALEMKLVVS